MESKSELRKKYRDLLSSSKNRIFRSESKDDSGAIIDHDGVSGNQNPLLVERLKVFFSSQGGTWVAYHALAGEPDLGDLFAQSPTVQWAFPRIEDDELQYYLPVGRAEMVRNALGILEPDPQQARRLEDREIEGFIIPGLAFDENGYRLGRGRGVYDRSLARMQKLNQKYLKIGVAFDWQIHNQNLPIEPFDIPMDRVFTDLREVDCCLRHLNSMTTVAPFQKKEKTK